MEFIIDNLTIGYKSGVALCPPMSAKATSGQAIAIIGNNGIGKSTLLRTLAGIKEPMGGHILLDNKNLMSVKSHLRSRLVSFVSTEIVSTAYLTTEQVIALGRAPYSGWAFKLSSGDRAAIEHAMAMVGVTPLAGRCIDTLSDGQRQRVMVGRAIAQDTPIILLDEPTAFLDPENRELIIKLLCDLAHKTSKIVIFSTHEVEIARKYADTVWQMSADGLKLNY